jgi:DNA-binding XRE family transcriptional regulator
VSFDEIGRRLGITTQEAEHLFLAVAGDCPSRCAFATRLRALRRTAGLTQAQLAARSGVCSQRLSSLERGLHAPRQRVVLRLAAALGVSPVDLLSTGPRACSPLGER